MNTVYLNTIYFVLVFSFLFSACKDKKKHFPGCRDVQAKNFNSQATIDDGSCAYDYSGLDFESYLWDDWYHTGGGGWCFAAYTTSVNSGFMPTQGQYFFRCIPKNDCTGSFPNQGLSFYKPDLPGVHKGILFDYTYSAIAGTDSILNANVVVGFGGRSIINGQQTNNYFSRSFSDNKASFGGFPVFTVQKKDEYIELPEEVFDAGIAIKAIVTKGTFTFDIDNIRVVDNN